MLEPLDFFLQDGLKFHCIEGYCFMKTILFVSHHCPTKGLNTFCKQLLMLENNIDSLKLLIFHVLSIHFHLYTSKVLKDGYLMYDYGMF